LLQRLTTHDPTAIGAASTLSATAYQAINYSSLVTRARQWTKTTGALGIVRAHSGSVVGLLYPPGTPLEDAASWLSSQFKGRIIQTHLTNTGYKIESLSLENAI